jgi:hypothetical protein
MAFFAAVVVILSCLELSDQVRIVTNAVSWNKHLTSIVYFVPSKSKRLYYKFCYAFSDLLQLLSYLQQRWEVFTVTRMTQTLAKAHPTSRSPGSPTSMGLGYCFQLQFHHSCCITLSQVSSAHYKTNQRFVLQLPLLTTQTLNGHDFLLFYVGWQIGRVIILTFFTTFTLYLITGVTCALYFGNKVRSTGTCINAQSLLAGSHITKYH